MYWNNGKYTQIALSEGKDVDEELELLKNARRWNNEVFTLLMRKLNRVSMTCPRKTYEKIQYIISQLENLHYFPEDIRGKIDYLDDDLDDDDD